MAFLFVRNPYRELHDISVSSNDFSVSSLTSEVSFTSVTDLSILFQLILGPSKRESEGTYGNNQSCSCRFFGMKFNSFTKRNVDDARNKTSHREVVSNTLLDHCFKMVAPQAKAWCFTLNNYTPQDVERLSVLPEGVKYLLFGREVGEGGTPHLQGLVVFEQRKRLNQVVAVIGQCHFTPCRNVPASVIYCKKDGDFVELGSVTTQGKRSDLDEFKDAVKGGMLSLDDIREAHSEVLARYPRFVYEYIQQHTPPPVIEAHPLRGWQVELNAELNLAADSRHVRFIVDSTGNAGKSWFCHYYASLHTDVQVMLPGKKADMCFALDSTIRVLFVDAPRSKQGEFLQYDFLEDVKNGYVFSPKYESRNKRLQKCHVVVMMNEDPDMTKLSADRYLIKVI